MRVGERSLPLGRRTLVMGILNLTPDSFSGDGLGSEADRVSAALARADQFIGDGADILDIGGESTRRGSQPVGGRAEIDRVVPVIAALRERFDAVLSIDTRHADVAAAALDAGADIVNDVSGLQHDPALAGVVAAAGVPVVIQHMRGTPQTMAQHAVYEDVVEEVIAELAERLEQAASAGIAHERIIVDPGIGFAKGTDHNLRLLRELPALRRLGCPILVGVSRKRFIGEVLGAEVDDRLEGTAAAVALSVAGGADIVRVHDVREMARVVRMADAIVRSPA